MQVSCDELSSSMARRVVLISVVLSFLFIQLASSHDQDRRDACVDAMIALNDRKPSCDHTTANPNIMTICGDRCLKYYYALFDNCTPEVYLYKLS